MRAAEKWSSSRVQGLLKLGVDVNDENMIGETALSHAAREDVRTYSKYYSRLGARIDVSFEGTPSPRCSVGGNVSDPRELIHDGLQIKHRELDGLTPLWYPFPRKELKRRNI